MYINEEFKQLVEEKYEEAKNANQTSIIISNEILGDLTLYINEKPQGIAVMAEFESGDNKLYVGGSLKTTTS